MKANMEVCKPQAIVPLRIKRDDYLVNSLGRDDVVQCPSLTNFHCFEKSHQFPIRSIAIFNHRYIATHVSRINTIDMIDLLSRQTIKLNSMNP